MPKKIFAENQIDLLIPTCEEIFHMAMANAELPLFAEPIKKLKQFHNKWEFVVHAVDNDLHVPETILVQNQEDLLHAYAQWRGLVLKPLLAFRFADLDPAHASKGIIEPDIFCAAALGGAAIY